MPAPRKKPSGGILGGDLRQPGALGFFDDQAAEEADAIARGDLS